MTRDLKKIQAIIIKNTWVYKPFHKWGQRWTKDLPYNIRHPVIEGICTILPNFIIHTQRGHIPSVSQITPSDVWTHKCCITNDTIQQGQMRLCSRCPNRRTVLQDWQNKTPKTSPDQVHISKYTSRPAHYTKFWGNTIGGNTAARG